MTAWCGNCRFFSVGTTKAFPKADGECVRHAPRGTVIGLLSDARWQHFPPMNASGRCGEHQKLSFGAWQKRNDELEALIASRKAVNA